MISPYMHRNNRHGSWATVTATSGQVRGAIQFDGTVRASYTDGSFKHIKGSFTLERWSGSPTRYRISCSGFHATTEGDTVGDIPMPLCPWNPVLSKGQSNNMIARVLMMTMKPCDTDDGLKSVQVIIPVVSGGHRAAKTVFQGFVAADTELRAGENLVGR